jgi:hypothetical protein
MQDANFYRLRISLLWVLAIVALFAYATFAADEEPSNLANLSLVHDQDLVNTSLIMMVFAFLSLALSGPLNRLTNIIAGSVFSILLLIVLIDGATVNPSGDYNLMTGAAVALLGAIVWFAYRMPRRQAQAGPQS